MRDRSFLDAAILEVMRAEAALASLLTELVSAARNGNPDCIGAAAFEAQTAGDLLASSLSRVFAKASEASAEMFDVMSAPRQDSDS